MGSQKNENLGFGPYSVNYIGNYMRNYAVFGGLALLGAEMLHGAANDSLPTALIKSSLSFGLPDNMAYGVVGAVGLLLGLALCVYNGGATIWDVLVYHNVDPNPQPKRWIKSVAAFVVLTSAALITYFLSTIIFGFMSATIGGP